MTRILTTMVEEELVSRIADTEDSRAWRIDITTKGGKVIVEVGLIAKRVPPAWYDAVARALVMKAVEAPEGPGDLASKVDYWKQQIKA